MIDAPTTPSPPAPGISVLRHDVTQDHRQHPLFFFDVQDVDPDTQYIAEASVFIPASFEGKTAGLVMIGFAAERFVPADLAVRDKWQKLSIAARVPENQHRTFPALMANAEPGSVIFSAGWSLRRAAPSASRRTGGRKQSVKLISIAELRRLERRTESGHPLVKSSPCLPDVTVDIPTVSFGQVRRPEGNVTEWPPNAWDLAQYSIKGADLHEFRDAVVHGEQGIITVGDYLIAESLYMAQPTYVGFEQTGNDSFSLVMPVPDIEIDAAAHLLCGFVGNRNYAHWWVDIVPAFLVPPFHTAFFGAQLLLPKLRQSWQADTLSLIEEARGKSIFVGEQARVACRTLRFVPQITHSDLTPHPFRAVILDAIKQRAGYRGEGGRRIYVTRRDARARRLLNEDEVVTLLEGHGFEAVTLTGMKLAEQIKLFASASHVVGAHGAGLGNVIFCGPGSVLCEFQMTSNVQWTIRRLAAVTNMRYGCLMGTAADESVAVNLRDWTIDLGELASVVDSQEFA